MKDNLKISIRAFIFFSLILGGCFSIAFSIIGGGDIKEFAFGVLGGIFVGAVMSLYLLIMLVLFEKKLLFYSNMPSELKKRGVRNVYYEGVAGNVAGTRIKYGGLFLTDDTVFFIPHRFAMKSLIIELPLTKIQEVKKSGINLRKHFSGGLRKRLVIETKEGRYEFSVWDIDRWTEKLHARIIDPAMSCS